MRAHARTILIIAAALLFCGGLVRRYHWLGGPYFELPRTVQDHVWPTPFPSRDMILLAERAADLVPRGTTVTAIHPVEAPAYDRTLVLTAAGMMPRHRLLLPEFDDPQKRPRFVLAVRTEFVHPSYRLFRELPEGRVYEVIP